MRLDEREVSVRLALAALVGVGPVVALYASYVGTLAPPIPYKLIPDVRPVLLFAVTFGIAAFAAFGPGRRRAFLVAYLISVHGVFALELSTIHWIVPYPGPIGGTRADPLRLISAVSGLVAALLLHARVHAETTRNDLVARGVPAGEAAAVSAALWRAAGRSVLIAAALAAGLAFLVEGAAVVAGDEGAMPLGAALGLGAAVLAAVGGVVAFAAKRPA